jgi:hypothetical protein
LCGDPTWSCTIETCLAEDGTAIDLVPEAGFLELPGADFTSHTAGHICARVWYSFQPARAIHRASRSSFCSGIMDRRSASPFNTGHFTLDPNYTDGADFAENDHRWTDFANLIFVDEPGAGFSYHLPRADGSRRRSPSMRTPRRGFPRIIFRFLSAIRRSATCPSSSSARAAGAFAG